ncbi:AAA ATPase-like protein [Sphingomonas sp. PP-F2F-A104-K0414]|uniref:ATP-binding protein n=1 Tax=Sphingomonas sp. PP-F2F-A104-K0414 TaxID=2135661 RepID=UPI0010484D51|nr:ATP-binding protein [Sphingomonas sp. PP-F2F-A104-K0414]TCP96743.1 AAA ATPase-like protein [Sphingomonas sp. PP-F2F-A104-K0414]
MVEWRTVPGPRGLAEALEFAALSGPFDPASALTAVDRKSREARAEVASALAKACDTNPDQSNRWLMLASQRQQTLRRLADSGELQPAIGRRRAADPDDRTRDLLDALTGEGQFSFDRVEAALGTAAREWLVRLTTVLDWAGGFADAGSLLEPSRTAMKRLERTERRKDVLSLPFVGRDRELGQLMSRLAAAPGKEVRGVFLSGPPGVGKSALLEQVIARHIDEHGSVVVRLDFDRAGLDVTDLRMLTMEVARQITDRVIDGTEQLATARLQTAGYREDAESVVETRRAFPAALGREIARTVGVARRPLLVVVDTLESLQARGATHLDQLFAWLQQLADHGVADMAVLVAGRAAPSPEFRRVVGKPLALEGLAEFAALEFTERLSVLPADRPVVVDRAAGIPLAIKLAADIVRTDGVKALPAGRPNAKLASALLYRILLSRIDDDVLRRLAHPGLIVRRISADLLRDVIAPAVGLPRLADGEARSLFDALALQHWLVEIDPADPSFVRHRSDIRRDLLPLIYEDKPALCAKIDREATRWFAARGDRESQVDALYHRLQQLRRNTTRPAVSEDLARSLDAATLEELPDSARVLVRQIAGEFSGVAQSRAVGLGASDDPRLVRELVNILAKSDWAEGRSLVDRYANTGSLDPRSRLADAVRAFWWRAGQWYDANWLLRERDRLGGDDADIGELEPVLAVARMEMRGEYGRAAKLLGDPKALLERTPLRSSATSVSRYGGLAFRLRKASPDILAAFELEEAPDPVSLAFDRWTYDPPAPWNAHSVEFAHRRLMSVGPTFRGPARPWVETQTMASLTPYAGVVVNLAQGDRRLSTLAREAAQTLLGGHHSPLALADEITVTSSVGIDIEPIAAIANAGLLAEWAEALGFVLEHPNLRSVGRAADNWRRTMAGDWRYGRPPRGWRPRGIDEVLAARIDRHRASHDPVTLAFLQLAAWVPHVGSGEDVWDLIRRRAPGALESASMARREGGTEAAAAKLRRYRIPTAFVPSVITLIEVG